MQPRDEMGELAERLSRVLPATRLRGRPDAALLEAADGWADAVWRAAMEAGAVVPDRVEEAGDFAHRAVFICGVHRSGTTLMRDLLDGHPEMCVLPSEGGYFTGLRARIRHLPEAVRAETLGKEWLRRLANPTNQPPYWLLGPSGGENDPYVRFARSLLGWWPVLDQIFGSPSSLRPHLAIVLAYASVTGRALWWIDKTPTNEFHVRRLRKELPSTRVIHMVRDPLTVYASRKRLEEQVFGSMQSPRRVLAQIRRSLRIACLSEGPGHLVIRFEDLIERPDEMMGRVAAFLDIEKHPSLLHPTVAGMPAFPNSAFEQGQLAGRIVVHHGERLEGLTRAEMRRIIARTRPFAERLGYA